ncbi:DNA-directed RNA polymerase subunit beta', partial [Staphylococcus epidermidis]
LLSRIGLSVVDMDTRPFPDEQRHKIMVTSVGKVMFNEIMPTGFPYLNEPTTDNLMNGVPDKYFIDNGEDIHDYLSSAPMILPFKKGFLS